MANKQQVIELHRQHPNWGSGEIARVLDCDSAYVRATFYRNGMKLPPRPDLASPEGLRAQAARLLQLANEREAAREMR